MTDHNELEVEGLLDELARPSVTNSEKAALREQIVVRYRPMVREIAGRYRGRGEPLEDLVQAAYVGLMKAVNGYDRELGHAFRGYAATTMSGEVKRHFRDKTWAVRVPRIYQERRSELNRLATDMSQELGRPPSTAELGRAMGLSEQEMVSTVDAAQAYSTLSLDAPLTAEDGTAALGDVLPEKEDAYGRMVDAEAVKPLVDELPAREREILLLRFFGNKTQSEIAGRFGISQMHVSRILKRVLDDLRETLCD